MPELPEVETLCRQLHRRIAGKIIADVESMDPKLPNIKIKGQKIIAVRREGKTVAIVLDDGHRILIHLRMTGRLLWQKGRDRPRHSRWLMSFSEGHVFLVDPRRFATVKVTGAKAINPDNDLLNNFDRDAFLNGHGKSKAAIKNILLNQRAIAGIGNIYASEILHLSRISPWRRAADINKTEWNKIFCSSRRILLGAIEKRGTSISDWRDLYGRMGKNQNELLAYGREGKACVNCGDMIIKSRQGGRSTFYCFRCQK